MLEQGHYESVILHMTQCLEAAEQSAELDQLHDYSASMSSLPPCTTSLDKSQLYYDLGRAYIGLQDYISATICLVKAAKEKRRVQE